MNSIETIIFDDLEITKDGLREVYFTDVEYRVNNVIKKMGLRGNIHEVKYYRDEAGIPRKKYFVEGVEVDQYSVNPKVLKRINELELKSEKLKGIRF